VSGGEGGVRGRDAEELGVSGGGGGGAAQSGKGCEAEVKGSAAARAAGCGERGDE